MTVRPALFIVCLLGAMVAAACSSPCQEALGVYPPEHIVVTGVASIEVPHIAWECPGFHSDSMDPPPSVGPDQRGEVRVEVNLRAGSTVDVRLGNRSLVLQPGPVEGGNEWTVDVPDPSEPLIVRLCSAEEACAMYWVNMYSG